MKSKGTSQNYINDNSDKHNQTVEWDVDYDGKQADVDVHVKSDGDEKHLQFQLDNEDLANMLNYPSEPKNLEDRLLRDYPVDDDMKIMSPKPNWEELGMYDDDKISAFLFDTMERNKEEEPASTKIKINIVPKSYKKTPKYYKPRFTKRKTHKTGRRKKESFNTRKLITGKIPSQRRSLRNPKTMHVKLHQVKQ